MSLKTKTLTPTFAAVWVCVAIFAIWQTNLRANDVASAIGAGLLLLTSLFYARYILSVPFASAPLIYLSILGLFHLGLILPWALGIYDISRAPLFTPYGLSHAIALIDYSIVAFHIGIIIALSRKKHAFLFSQSVTDTED